MTAARQTLTRRTLPLVIHDCSRRTSSLSVLSLSLTLPLLAASSEALLWGSDLVVTSHRTRPATSQTRVSYARNKAFTRARVVSSPAPTKVDAWVTHAGMDRLIGFNA